MQKEATQSISVNKEASENKIRLISLNILWSNICTLTHRYFRNMFLSSGNKKISHYAHIPLNAAI